MNGKKPMKLEIKNLVGLNKSENDYFIIALIRLCDWPWKYVKDFYSNGKINLIGKIQSKKNV